MKNVLVVTAALALLCLCISAQSNVFNLGTGFTNLETVIVGDPGNVGEISGAGAGGSGTNRVCGAVDYTYNIGTYEVTAKQYTDFLNHKAKTDSVAFGLYSSNMWTSAFGCKIQRTGTSGNYVYSVADDWANRPVNYVSFWDACRFTNWLSNGQGDGDTETGAYTLNGYNSQFGGDIVRNTGWKWAVTSENEWYKAAYYKGGGTNAGYWDYPTMSNTTPSNVGYDGYTDPGNHANYYNGTNTTISAPYYRTIVGEFEKSSSAYGTFDQGGNIWEWNESVGSVSSSYTYRCVRGGSFNYFNANLKASDRLHDGYPASDNLYYGFRVVQAVPEPASIIALAGGVVGLLGIRRRRSIHNTLEEER